MLCNVSYASMLCIYEQTVCAKSLLPPNFLSLVQEGQMLCSFFLGRWGSSATTNTFFPFCLALLLVCVYALYNMSLVCFSGIVAHACVRHACACLPVSSSYFSGMEEHETSPVPSLFPLWRQEEEKKGNCRLPNMENKFPLFSRRDRPGTDRTQTFPHAAQGDGRESDTHKPLLACPTISYLNLRQAFGILPCRAAARRNNGVMTVNSHHQSSSSSQSINLKLWRKRHAWPSSK